MNDSRMLMKILIKPFLLYMVFLALVLIINDLVISEFGVDSREHYLSDELVSRIAFTAFLLMFYAMMLRYKHFTNKAVRKSYLKFWKFIVGLYFLMLLIDLSNLTNDLLALLAGVICIFILFILTKLYSLKTTFIQKIKSFLLTFSISYGLFVLILLLRYLIFCLTG